ncbi:MAG: 50S ribosomal protein L11 methyltransferase [Pyrinomonadaceae bacterium]
MTPAAPKTWFAVDVMVEADAIEAIESAFNELESLGTEINGLRKEKNEPLCVTGYFEHLPLDIKIQESAQESLRIAGRDRSVIKSVTTRRVEQTDWLAEWKKHWRPVTVGRFIVAPPWEEVSDSEKYVIRIEPNMAFGTGTHETTQLCLTAIDRLYRAGQSFLDVGTGTGILAIAATMLGARSVLACDTDADSIRIAIENAEANGAAEDIQFTEGSIDAATPRCDLVCANLTLDVIKPILPLLLEKTGETLLLSGILKTQEAEISTELDMLGAKPYKVHTAGEWISVVVDLKPASVE